MSTFIPTQDSFKEKSKLVRKFMAEKYGVEVSQGHGLEMISQIFGYKDWNTASAALASRVKPVSPNSTGAETVGELTAALAAYDSSSRINAEFKFKLKDFLDVLDEYDDPESEIVQGFSFTVEDFEGQPELKLKLEHEDLYSETSGRSLR